MEIVVRGRHLSQDVGDSFRAHCQSKLERLGRLDHRLRRIDVELSHESNPRQHDVCQRVELTVFRRGPVIRAEACAKECYAAFEQAFDKLEERMRRAASRHRASHSHSHHVHLPSQGGVVPDPGAVASLNGHLPEQSDDGLAPGEVELENGLIVREKTHEAEPLELDEAVHRMELVGHDFYLFCDAKTGTPSVVYKRRGYDYGVLRLSAAAAESLAMPAAVGAAAD